MGTGAVTGKPVVQLPQSALDGLRAGVRGTVLTPGAPGFEDSRTVWNAMIDRQPSLVLRCLGVADVIAGVRFARAHGLTLTIKGGGHNIAGLAVCDGGLMLDMSLMRGVGVDASGRIARAQAGCLLGDVDRETQVHGLAATMGFVSNTGIAGLTLGGGFGYLTRRFGWTSDTVRSMEVVTSEGRVVRASERENSDLFWGLCGGGGNFGIVTQFEYELQPVGPEIVGGIIAWRAEHAAQVFELAKVVAEEAPLELTVVGLMRLAPPAPWLAKDVHGKPIVGLALCHTGGVEEAERLVARFKAFGSPVGDIVQRRPYATQQSLLDATQPKGRRYYWKSEYLRGIGTGIVDKVIEHTGRITSPHSAILLFQLGGVIHRRPEDHSAAGNRDSAWVLNIAAAWEDAATDATHVGWARSAWENMRAFSTGGTYVNFLTEDETSDRLHSAYGENYDRLVQVKKQWDPENVFRVNKNIAPN
jgi:FAD/FMN-containing dehydrogenase